MNAYRSYMDRAAMSGQAHARLMDALETGEKPRRGGARFAQWGAAAACLALACFAGWSMLSGQPPRTGGEVTPPSVVATATPSPTPPPAVRDEYVLSPEETLYTPTEAAQVNFEGGTELAADMIMPGGTFKMQLTRDEMIGLLGGENDAPWYLMWSEYDVGGEAIYDGEGRLWRVTLSGREDGVNTFYMVIRPGTLPEDCMVLNEEPTEINGVPVQGIKGQYSITDGAMGESRTLAFMAGEIGVRFTASNRSAENAEYLASLVANCYAGLPNAETLFSLSLAELNPFRGEIPEWRSEKLTLDEARTEEGFGKYVPTWVPEGFAFESAHRELGQGRDWLRVFWAGYYTDISVTINNEEFYDGSNGGGHTIPAADLTDDLLKAQFEYVDNDAGDVPGHRGRFAVDYGEGVIVEYSFKGVTPEEAAKILNEK